MKAAKRTVSIIGSFRKHYDVVRSVWETFTQNGLLVTSPKGTPVLDGSVPFVRFESDPNHWEDDYVQTVALHRILRADFVYVVSPGGYVGRTTCYEIGRVIQAGRPIYFSNLPKDLPIFVPQSHVLSGQEIVTQISNGTFTPEPLHISSEDGLSRHECDLLAAIYRDDEYFDE